MEAPVVARRGGSGSRARRHLQDTPHRHWTGGMVQCRLCTRHRVVLSGGSEARRLAFDHERWRSLWSWFGRPHPRRLQPGLRELAVGNRTS